jgi:ZIP family zinc transporter
VDVDDVARAALYVSLPVGAALVGSLIALVRRPSAAVASAIQHFAAGVVMAALVGEVLPGLREQGHLPWVVAGFSVGVALMLALGAWSRRLEQRRTSIARSETYVLPIGLLAAVGVDLLIDGELVGLGVTLGSSTGLIITLALTVEILFLSLSVVAELTDAGVPRGRSALITVGLGLLTGVGAVLGAALLGDASHEVLAAGLAFGTAALLYLAVEELLVEAHEERETTVLSAMFFLGFLLVYVLGEVAA